MPLGDAPELAGTAQNPPGLVADPAMVSLPARPGRPLLAVVLITEGWKHR